jgi:hypothetical protein
MGWSQAELSFDDRLSSQSYASAKGLTKLHSIKPYNIEPMALEFKVCFVLFKYTALETAKYQQVQIGRGEVAVRMWIVDSEIRYEARI